MKCPRCGKELELQNAGVNLDRNGLRVWITCSDNICEFTKILELSIDDIIGKSPETQAETRATKMRMPSGNPRAYWQSRYQLTQK